jgi:hypothetical protein
MVRESWPDSRSTALDPGETHVGVALLIYSEEVGSRVCTLSRLQGALMDSPEHAEWDRLRDEILQAQRARSDLLKWKLVLVGTLGSVGLGLAGSRRVSHADLVLCAVPLVSAYVDLLACHLSIRIRVIGAYIRGRSGDQSYESFVEHVRVLKLAQRTSTRRKGVSAFDLEDWAIWWSTGFLSLSVLVYGIYVGVSAPHNLAALLVPFIMSGLTGIATSFRTQRSYRSRLNAVDALVQTDHAPIGPASAPTT